MGNCFRNKRFLAIFLLISLAAFLVLPKICLADDFENINLEKLGKYLELPLGDAQKLMDTLRQVFVTQSILAWSSGEVSEEKTAVAVTLKKVVTMEVLRHLVEDAPLEMLGGVIKEAKTIFCIIYFDPECLLEKLEKESVKEATEYGMKMLFQNEIRVAPGAIKFKYTSYKGGEKEIILQYVMIYKPESEKRAKVAIRFYMPNSIEAPAPEEKGTITSLPVPDLKKDLPPFIVEITGRVEKNKFDNYQWVDESGRLVHPSVNIDFPPTVPDLGIKLLSTWEKYLLKPIETTIKEVEIIITKVTGKSLPLTKIWNEIKSFLSKINPFGPATVVEGPKIEEAEIEKEIEEVEEISIEVGQEVGQNVGTVEVKPQPTPPQQLTLEEMQEKLDDIAERIKILNQKAAELSEVSLQKAASEKLTEKEEVKKEETKEETLLSLPKILISEVCAGLDKAENEFVEFYNPNDSAVSLSDENFNLKLVNSSNDITKKKINWNKNVIPAKGFFLLVGGELKIDSQTVSPDATFSSQLTGTSGVIIANGQDNVLDKVAWGKLDKLPPAAGIETQGVILEQGLQTGKSLERKKQGDNLIDNNNNSQDFILSSNPSPINSLGEKKVYLTLTSSLSGGSSPGGGGSSPPPASDTQPPIANAGPDQTVIINQAVSFDGSQSSDNVKIVSYQWDIDNKDGLNWNNPDLTGEKPTFTQGYSQSSIYTVTLRVSDKAGNSATDTLTVTVIQPPKILISEIQIDTTTSSSYDFVELYNPNNFDIDISGFQLKKKASTGSETSIRVFSTGSKILAQSYFLWANSNYALSGLISADATSTQTLAKNNSLALFDKNGNLLDAVAWGSSTNPFVKGSPFSQNPEKNQSLGRKWIEGTGYQDTDNNSVDFEIQSPTPKAKNETFRDIIPPETTILNKPSSLTNQTQAVFTFSSSEENSTFECKIDEENWQICFSPQQYSNLLDGLHTFQVRAKDISQNTGPIPAQYQWQIDTVSLQAILLSTPPVLTNQTTATFAFSSNEEDIFFQCQLDEQSWEECASPKTYENLTESEHHFQLQTVDLAGNPSGPLSYSWTIDLTLPEVSFDEISSPQTQTSFLISWTGEGKFQFRYSDDETNWIYFPESGYVSETKYQFTGEDETTYYFQIRARDEAGNKSEWQEMSTKISLPKPILKVDKDSLGFEGIEYGSDPESQTLAICNFGQANLEWEIATFSEVSWLIINSISGQISPDDCLEISVSVNISDLCSGQYPTKIFISSDGGSKEIKTVLKLEEDNVPPANANLVLADLTNESNFYTQNRIVKVAITNDQDASFWFLSENQVKPEANSSDWQTTRPSTFALSEGDSSKTVYIWTKDKAGNISESGKYASIILDTTPPIARAGEDRIVEINQPITFDASGSSDNIEIVSYKWDVNDIDGLNWGDPDLTGENPIIESGYLTPGIYIVTLQVSDFAGNLATDTLTVTVNPPPRLSFQRAIGYTDPDNQWEDETLAYDGNINTYARVYLSGGRDSSPLELLAPSGKTTQGIRFWGSGGPLQVDIYYDGNWHCLRDWPWGISSAPANEWVELTYPSKIVEKARIKFHGRVLSGWSYLNEFQFKATKDTALPEISNLQVSEITKISALISWETDEESTSMVEYGTTLEYGETKTITEYSFSHNISLIDLAAGTTYHYKVGSTNKNENTSWSEDNTFATTPPELTYLPAIGHNIDKGDDRPDQANLWENEPLSYDGDINTFAKSQVTSQSWTAWLEFIPPREKSQGIRFWIDAQSQISFFRVELLYQESWHCYWNRSWPDDPTLQGEWVTIDYPEKIVEKARVKFNTSLLGSPIEVRLNEFQFKAYE